MLDAARTVGLHQDDEAIGFSSANTVLNMLELAKSSAVTALRSDSTGANETVSSASSRPPSATMTSQSKAPGLETLSFDVVKADPIGRDNLFTKVFSRQFYALQEWEGYVLSVGAETLTARLSDITAGANFANEEAQIPLEELQDGDRGMVSPGRIFRWTIGYYRDAMGTKLRASKIIFRRLPAWTVKQLAEADAEAKSLADKIRSKRAARASA